MPCLIGVKADLAEARLSALGYTVKRVVYLSRRGVPDADSTRVIRARRFGKNSIELTVSHFKTQV